MLGLLTKPRRLLQKHRFENTISLYSLDPEILLLLIIVKTDAPSVPLKGNPDSRFLSYEVFINP